MARERWRAHRTPAARKSAGEGKFAAEGKSAGERIAGARDKLGSASKKVGHASKVGATGVASASKKTAEVGGKVGKATGRRIRGLTGAQGARESGLSRLIELGAVNAAGDTAFAVSLAGTVFFTVPSDQARDRVALFLVLTMAPFALMAPLIGPILDRFRHGRRWAIGATLGLRGFLVWSLAASISGNGSAWLYPAALGCLVASKAYGVTRASAVPRLLPKEITLVTANSRISLAGVAGATIGAGIAAAFASIGPQWSLRWAAVVYTIGLILAIRLPSAVDSPAGEEITGTAGRDARRRAITAAVARGIRCNLGLRFVSGFLTMYLAFLLRDEPISGIDGALAAGAVIAAAGIGNSLGTVAGSLLKARKPETVVLVVLFADAAVAVGVAVLYGLPAADRARLHRRSVQLARQAVAGRDDPARRAGVRAYVGLRALGDSAPTGVGDRRRVRDRPAAHPALGLRLPRRRIARGRLLRDSDAPDTPARRRTSQAGRRRRPARRRIASPSARRRRSSPREHEHGPSSPPASPNNAPTAPNAPAPTTNPPSSGSPRNGPRNPTPQDPRQGGSASQESRQGGDAPADDRTARLRRNRGRVAARPAGDRTARIRRSRGGVGAPDQPVGRWWSGQPEDDADDTLEDRAPWAEEPTVERERDRGLFRRRPGNTRRPPR